MIEMNSTKLCNSSVDKFCEITSQSNSADISLGFIAFEILAILIGTYIFSISIRKTVPGLKFILEIIISHLIFLCTYPFIGVVIFVNCIVRFFVSCYLKLNYGNDIKLVPGLDAYWIPDSPGCPSIIEQFHVIKGDCKLDRIWQVFNNGIHFQEKGSTDMLYLKLKFKLVTIFGYYCLARDKNFDVRDHIRYIFPNCHKRLITEDEVTEELQRLHKHPFSSKKSPWEILIIPKFDYKDPGREEGVNYYAMLYRINHAFIDGMSFVNLIDTIICDKHEPFLVDPRAPIKTSFLESILMYTKMFILGPRTLLSSAAIKDKHCFHGPKLYGPHVFVRTKPFNFEVIKQIKAKTKATIMSIFLTVIAGGMKNLAKQKHFHVPKKIHAAITCVMLPYKCNSPVNQFSMALIPITLGKNETDKILESTTSSAKIFANSIDPVLNFYGIGIIGSLPASFITFITDKFNATFVLTNLPAAKNPWQFYGDPVVGFTGWNLIKGTTGLGVLISNYAGKVQFSIVGDVANFTDVNDVPKLASAMELEMQKLAAHVGISENDVFFTKF